jgi:tRNA threonylcarbamoyl adenosine modification protein (Sua5/YciO/YrdC/YwlC family)
VHDREFRWLRKYLPGPYCFILNSTREVPKIVQSSRKQVGVRVPNHAVARALVEELGHPIISSTAAKPGADPHVDPNEIDDDFPGMPLILDGGPGGLLPTTIVDLSGEEPVVVREGAGDAEPFR